MKNYLVWHIKDTQTPSRGVKIKAVSRGKAKSAFMKKFGFRNYLNICAVRCYEG